MREIFRKHFQISHLLMRGWIKKLVLFRLFLVSFIYHFSLKCISRGLCILYHVSLFNYFCYTFLNFGSPIEQKTCSDPWIFVHHHCDKLIGMRWDKRQKCEKIIINSWLRHFNLFRSLNIPSQSHSKFKLNKKS